MMLRLFRNITFSLLFITPALSFGQSAEAEWGIPFKNVKGDLYTSVIGQTANGFIVEKRKITGTKTFEYIIERYSKSTFDLEFSTTIYNGKTASENEKTEFVVDVNGSVMLNDAIVVFITKYHIKEDTYIVFAQKLSLDGSLIGKMIELDRYKTPEKSLRGQFEFCNTPDKEHVVIYYKRPYLVYADENFKVRKYNKEMDLVWEKNLVFPYKGKDFNLFNLKVMQDGNVYMLARIFSDSEAERQKNNNREATYFYRLLSFTDTDTIQETTFKQTDISISKKWITDVAYTLVHDEIVCSGFYADKKDMSISGMFFLRMEKSTGKSRGLDTEEFSKNLLVEYIPEKPTPRGMGLRDFELHDLVVKNDGSVIFIAEQFYIETVCYTDNKGAISCKDNFNYNDIFVVNVNSKGEIAWHARIPKKTKDANNGYYLSYALAVSENKLHFLYNDNPANIEIKDIRRLKPMSPSSSVTVLAEINSKGEVSREKIFDGSNSKVYIKSNLGEQIADKEMIIFGINGSKNQWGKMKFY